MISTPTPMPTGLTSLPLNAAATLRHREDGRFKTARLSLFAVLPATAEGSPLTTLLFGILRRGSAHYPRLSLLNRRLDELYGTTLTIRNYLHGDAHVVCYTAEMPEEDFLPKDGGEGPILDGVMALLSDMILRPLRDPDGCLRAAAVEREKQTLADSLRALKNDTRAYAANRLREIMCAGEPYGLSIGGTVEQVEAITPQEVTDHYQSLLSRLRMEVFYTGRASVSRVAQAWEAAFGSWSPTAAPAVTSACHKLPRSPRAVSETMEVAQSKLSMGWSCGRHYGSLADDPRGMAAYTLCNELLGGMQSSLLFRRVREELGLCYYCDSALDLTKGILWVSCGIRADRREAAEEAIRSCLRDLQEGRFTEEELSLAKLSIGSVYRQMGDSQSAMEIYDFGALQNGTADTPQGEMERILQITPSEVAAAAGSFQPDTVFFLHGTAVGRNGGGGEEEAYD